MAENKQNLIFNNVMLSGLVAFALYMTSENGIDEAPEY